MVTAIAFEYMVIVGCQIYINRDGQAFLDPLKSALLFEIARDGSLSRAARNLNISYQHAWNLVNEINEAAPEPVVVKQRGGAHGGGTIISGYGERIISEYKAIEGQIGRLIGQINAEINF